MGGQHVDAWSGCTAWTVLRSSSARLSSPLPSAVLEKYSIPSHSVALFSVVVVITNPCVCVL